MSGETIPYRLRTNKFIDRQLFLDAVARAIAEHGGPEKYAYLSMGGKHMVDQISVYKRIGITNLFSFDYNEKVVARQVFNRPIDAAKCDAMPASSLAGKLDSLPDLFPSASNAIVWLDYTRPSERLTQLQEFCQVCERFQIGDIVRITLNANLGTLDEDGSDSWKVKGFSDPGSYRLSRLKAQLGSLVPTRITTIGENDFPSVLLQCVENACSAVHGKRSDIHFRPILLTSYKDGQRMVTATLKAVQPQNANNSILSLAEWPFFAQSWSSLINIVAPDLSSREKMRIDHMLTMQPNQIQSDLGFLLDESSQKSLDAISSYQQLHRYYPSFSHVEA